MNNNIMNDNIASMSSIKHNMKQNLHEAPTHTLHNSKQCDVERLLQEPPTFMPNSNINGESSSCIPI